MIHNRYQLYVSQKKTYRKTAIIRYQLKSLRFWQEKTVGRYNFLILNNVLVYYGGAYIAWFTLTIDNQFKQILKSTRHI